MITQAGRHDADVNVVHGLELRRGTRRAGSRGAERSQHGRIERVALAVDAIRLEQLTQQLRHGIRERCLLRLRSTGRGSANELGAAFLYRLHNDLNRYFFGLSSGNFLLFPPPEL